jgi:hypothetical protein
MKKILALFAIALLLSCSKDDDSTLPVTFQNLSGQWKFKSIVKADGTVIPYAGLCPSQTDYFEIFPYRKIVTYNYNQDCINTADNGCTDFNLTEDDRITVCSLVFDGAKVTHLTSSGFKIEYAQPRPLTFMIDDVTDAKTFIFEKL